MSADFMNIAVPEITDVVSARKKFNSATKSVGRQTLKKNSCVGVVNRRNSFQQDLPNKAVGQVETFSQLFLVIQVKQFAVPTFCGVYGDLGGKIPVVDNVLPSHGQKIYPTTSLDETCIEFEFKTDRNDYVDLRQSYFSLKLKFVKSRGYETYKNKETKKEHNKGKKAEESKEEEEEARFPLVTRVNFFDSIFSNVEVYINKQQIYNSKGVYAHKSYILTISREQSLNTRGCCIARVTTLKKSHMRLWKHLCLNPCFTRKLKMLCIPDGFMLYGKLGVDFFSTSELVCPKTKVTLKLIRARPNFDIISDNPNISFAIVNSFPYARRVPLKDDYHKKRGDMLVNTPVDYNYLKILAKTYIIPARQNYFFQENIFTDVPVAKIQTQRSLDHILKTPSGINNSS